MSRLKIKEKIEQEEKKKIMPLFIGVILIFVVSVVLNIVLRISFTEKIIIGAVLLLFLIYLLVKGYKSYYK